MIRITITQQEKMILEEERFTCGDPILSRRLHALYLKSLNVSHGTICEYAGITPNTLTSILKKYANGGLAEVKQLNYVPKQSPLEKHREQIKNHFEQHPPHTVSQACEEIEKLTGIKRKLSRIRIFLHQLGMKPRKVGGVPAKADVQKQEVFKKKASSRSSRKHERVLLRSTLWMLPTSS